MRTMPDQLFLIPANKVYGIPKSYCYLILEPDLDAGYKTPPLRCKLYHFNRSEGLPEDNGRNITHLRFRLRRVAAGLWRCFEFPEKNGPTYYLELRLNAEKSIEQLALF